MRLRLWRLLLSELGAGRSVIVGSVVGAAILIGGYAIVTAPDPSVAKVYVATTGNDTTCVRDNPSLPCLTLDRAYGIVLAGSDTIEVANGSYASQTISPGNPLVTTADPVTVQPAAGATPSFSSIRTSNGTVAGGADNIIFSDLVLNGGTRLNFWVDRGSDGITCDGCLITPGGFLVEADTNNTTIKNGEMGNFVAGGADPHIGSNSTNINGGSVPSAMNPPSNVVIDNMTIHDINGSAGTHSECLQIFNVHGLTITDSTFYRCNRNGTGSRSPVLFSGLDHNTGCTSEATCLNDNDYWDILIENNFILCGDVDVTPTCFGTLHMDGQFNDSYDCRDTDGDGWNAIIRNNTMLGQRFWACGSLATSSTGVSLWENNIISQPGGSGVNCSGTYRYNIWENGITCSGTNQTTGTISLVARNSNPPNLHLNDGTAAEAGANPSSFSVTDIDGETRPIPSATNADVGADERS